MNDDQKFAVLSGIASLLEESMSDAHCFGMPEVPENARVYGGDHGVINLTGVLMIFFEKLSCMEEGDIP